MIETKNVARQILLSPDPAFSYDMREWALSVVEGKIISVQSSEAVKRHSTGLSYEQIGILSQMQEASGPLRISRIKQIREWLNISLKDAKDMEENLFPYPPKTHNGFFPER